ncbi:MAG: DUF167 domain-containing protein [Nanoarchaeota archaeon]|nr:DUF167 domain-containing protein [Nanoarchaeota archaeon]
MRIKVIVKPNAPKSLIEKDGDIYKVSVKAKPENNKANIEVLKLLKKEFGSAKMVSGFTSRHKIVEIDKIYK